LELGLFEPKPSVQATLCRDLPVDTERSGANLTPRAEEDSHGERDAIPQSLRRGSELKLTEIRLKKGESVEKALRRLKKKIDREGTLKEVRNHRHFEKPSERKRRKMKAARFSAMLTARYADL
jgi:small subunit ribosomal protein S21